MGVATVPHLPYHHHSTTDRCDITPFPIRSLEEFVHQSGTNMPVAARKKALEDLRDELNQGGFDRIVTPHRPESTNQWLLPFHCGSLLDGALGRSLDLPGITQYEYKPFDCSIIRRACLRIIRALDPCH